MGNKSTKSQGSPGQRPRIAEPKAQDSDGKINISAFRKKAVAEMNEYRSKHGAAPLKEDQAINLYAQEWAEKLAKSGRFEHRREGKYGENIYMGSGNLYNNAIKMWYDEEPKYKYKSSGFNSGTGHFSQIVWKSSKSVGIGIAKSSSSGMTIVVANFDPPGNVMGQFEQNVAPKSR